MTRVKSKRSISAVAIMGLAFLTAMCGERGGAKVKVHPQSPDGKGAAGDDNGSLGAAGESSAGSGGSSGSGGASSGSATGGSGGTSDPTAGEGPGSGGSGATAAASAAGGSDNTTGGTGATGGSADSGGTDQTGGTGGVNAATGGASGTAGTAANGGSSSGAGGLGSGGFGGLPVSCELKTNCCAPDDPPCDVEGGCPSSDEFCCDADVGMRHPCVAGTEIEQIACLNCEGVSFGTGSCANCFEETDPLCSDPTWDDPCLTGGDAYCSDPERGFRLGCNGVSAGGTYYAFLACTCSAGATCVPTPCCDASSPACEPDGCDPAGSSFGYCCSSTLHYSESCTDLGDGTIAGQQRVCINDCTGQSYGTGSCADCTVPSDPPCDNTADWMTACNQIEPVYCSDLDAGFRMRCLERERTSGSSYPDIEIVCACNAPP
jgi:hypothetical protein